jgi:hypothetical protein
MIKQYLFVLENKTFSHISNHSISNLPRQKFNIDLERCHIGHNKLKLIISNNSPIAVSIQGIITIKRGNGIWSSILQKAPYDMHKLSIAGLFSKCR